MLTLFACLQPACRPALERHQAPVRHVLGGGRYTVEIENAGGGSALKLYSHSEGPTVTEGRYEISWGEGGSLKIDNGRLTIGGRSCGVVAEGDKIIVRTDGSVLVNGKPRQPE